MLFRSLRRIRAHVRSTNNHDVHDLGLQSDNIWNIAPATAPNSVPEQVVPFEDGWMDRAPEAAHSSVLEPNTDPSPKGICVFGPPDSSPTVCSGPRASVPIESNWAPVMEFTTADIFQHSPFGDVLDSLRSLSLSVRRLPAELCPARVGSWQRRNSFPTHHPLNCHGR